MKNLDKSTQSLGRALAINELVETVRERVVLEPGIVLATLDGVILWANRIALHMFGYEETEMLELQVGDLMPERYRSRHEEGVRRMRESGVGKLRGKLLSGYGKRKDGGEFACLVAPIMEQSQELGGGVLVTRLYDLSERNLDQSAMLEIESRNESKARQ